MRNMQDTKNAQGNPMKILWLLSNTSKIDMDCCLKYNPSHIISYGYRHIVQDEIIEAYRPINVHISLLPWNRGADPNFWSFYDDTPKGVTIHEMDSGLDTGPILLQKEMKFKDSQTLRETYDILYRTGWWLLFTNFDRLLNREIKPIKQHHYVKEAIELRKRLPKGWDTEVGLVKKMRKQL